MEKNNLVLIINQYYDDILKRIEKLEENLDFENKTDEEIEELKKIIKNDKAEMYEIIIKSKDFNISRLETKIEAINDIENDKALQTDEKLQRIKRKIFENKFCFLIYSKWFGSKYSRYLGGLYSNDFYLDQVEINNIEYVI